MQEIKTHRKDYHFEGKKQHVLLDENNYVLAVSEDSEMHGSKYLSLPKDFESNYFMCYYFKSGRLLLDKEMKAKIVAQEMEEEKPISTLSLLLELEEMRTRILELEAQNNGK